MSRKAPVSPRKSPKQKRSRTLVETILTATARILVRSGYEAASTNRVAEIAGVSVGSLYQYFPSKDALIASVIERTLETYIARAEKDLRSLGDIGLAGAIDAMMRSFTRSYLRNRTLIAVLFQHAARVERTRNVVHARKVGTALLLRHLERYRPELRPGDPERMAYVIVNAVMGVLLMAILDEEPGMSEDEIAAELAELAKGYLLGRGNG
jgi:AcrR family transcriptional regulator